MVLSRLELDNFKSFKSVACDFGRLSVLVGANASGKSNIIRALAFFRDIVREGLHNAVALQGGIEFVRNMQLQGHQRIRLMFHFKSDNESGQSPFMGTFNEFVYEIEILVADRIKFSIAFENLTFIFPDIGYGPNTLIVQSINGKLDHKIIGHPDNPDNQPDALMPLITLYMAQRRKNYQPTEALIHELSFLLPAGITQFGIFDFSLTKLRQDNNIVGRLTLSEDGSNIVLVLKHILENDDHRRKLFNLLTDILPFIQDISVDSVADKLLTFKIKERNSTDYLPAALLSDGTIKIIAMLVAIAFDKRKLVVFEEPERSLHPGLIDRLTSLFEDYSHQRQIMITTHNPEFVRNTDIENLMLVSRMPDGSGKISRPAEQKQVRAFLEDSLGLDDLFIQNLLEI